MRRRPKANEVTRMRQNGTDIQGTGSVTIRRLSGQDDGRIRLLAQLEGRREPEGPWLGAEVEGEVLAAISLTTGETLSDPFSRTAELRAMLELRAAQLRRRSDGGRRFRIRRSCDARAALPSSPPGSGGRLLTLLPRF
jgi:hypothetical protein